MGHPTSARTLTPTASRTTRWAGTSPVLVGDRIYCFSKKGRIPVFKASKKFELLADNHLGDGCNASPAFVDDAMIVRSFSHLYRVEDAQSDG